MDTACGTRKGFLTVKAVRTCNLKCSYCCSEQFIDGGISAIPIDLLTELIKKHNIKYVSFCGIGETTLCPNIAEAVIEASKYVDEMDMLTNLSARPLEWWDRLVSSIREESKLTIKPSLHLNSNNYSLNVKFHDKVEDFRALGYNIVTNPIVIISLSTVDKYLTYYKRDHERFHSYWSSVLPVWDLRANSKEREQIIDKLGDHYREMNFFPEPIIIESFNDGLLQSIASGKDPGYVWCVWELGAVNMQLRRDGDWGVYTTLPDFVTHETERRRYSKDMTSFQLVEI